MDVQKDFQHRVQPLFWKVCIMSIDMLVNHKQSVLWLGMPWLASLLNEPTPCINTHMHQRAHTHTHTHTQACTCPPLPHTTHIFPPTHTYKHAHAPPPSHTHTHSLTNIQTPICTHTHFLFSDQEVTLAKHVTSWILESILRKISQKKVNWSLSYNCTNAGQTERINGLRKTLLLVKPQRMSICSLLTFSSHYPLRKFPQVSYSTSDSFGHITLVFIPAQTAKGICLCGLSALLPVDHTKSAHAYWNTLNQDLLMQLTWLCTVMPVGGKIGTLTFHAFGCMLLAAVISHTLQWTTSSWCQGTHISPTTVTLVQ